MAISQINRTLIIYMALAVLTLLTYWDVQTFEFLDFDDNEFIVENRHIRDGFSIDSLVYAFTDLDTGIWQPITWLSHTFDCEVYGLNPKGHHWNNLILHLANSILLFLILYKMTGATYRCFFVAALFSIHPLQVESVAWVAERKNVLSTLFYFFSLLGYSFYVKDRSISTYLLVLLLFFVGLMSKPMLITMPVILLFLDFWPLGRFEEIRQRRRQYLDSNGPNRISSLWNSYGQLVLEKIPFCLLAIIFSVIAWYGQYASGGMTDLRSISLVDRVELSLVSYVSYLYKIIWPVDLAVFYPYFGHIPFWKVLGAFMILIGLTLLVLRFGRDREYLVVGWLWFLLTIAPVIGLVHLGDQEMADRYMYIPSIGLFIMISWGGYDLCRGLRFSRFVNVCGVCAVLIILFFSTKSQLQYWHNSTSLFTHALEVTSRNYIAHSNLGTSLLKLGKVDDAAYHFQKALEIKPESYKAHFDMGTVSAIQKDFAKAEKHFIWILNRFPNDIDAKYNLAVAFFEQGDDERSEYWFSCVLEINPKHVRAREYLAHSLMRIGKKDEAKEHYLLVLEQRDDLPRIHNNLGVIFYEERNLSEAIYHFEKALKYKPDYEEAYRNLQTIQRETYNSRSVHSKR